MQFIDKSLSRDQVMELGCIMNDIETYRAQKHNEQEKIKARMIHDQDFEFPENDPVASIEVVKMALK